MKQHAPCGQGGRRDSQVDYSTFHAFSCTHRRLYGDTQGQFHHASDLSEVNWSLTKAFSFMGCPLTTWSRGLSFAPTDPACSPHARHQPLYSNTFRGLCDKPICASLIYCSKQITKTMYRRIIKTKKVNKKQKKSINLTRSVVHE